jgi:hypothetical protein
MKSTIAQRVTTFAANISALEDERKALSLDILAEVGKRKEPDAQWGWVMENVAIPLADFMSKKYKVNVEASIGNRGTPVFKVGDERHEPTRNTFRLLVGDTGLVAKVGSQNKAHKIDPVASLVKQFNTLSKAEQKRFLASI